MSDDIDLTLLLRNLEARYWIEVWIAEDGLRHNRKDRDGGLIKDAMRLRQKGFRLRDIEKILKTSAARISRLLKGNGMEIRTTREINAEVARRKFNEVVGLCKKGMSVKEIEKELKMSKITIYKALRENGFEFSRGRAPKAKS